MGYKQDLRTIYTNGALTIAVLDKNLDILSLPALLFGSNINDLPSWAPDWSVLTEYQVTELRKTTGSETSSLANREKAGQRIIKLSCATKSYAKPEDQL